MATVRLRSISPLGEVENYLARVRVKPNEVFEVDAKIAGHAPFVRDLEPGEVPVAGHSIVVDGVVKYADPGSGLLAQVEHFERVVDEPEHHRKSPKAPTA